MSEPGGLSPPQNAPAPPKASVLSGQFPFVAAVAFLLVLATVIGSHWPVITGSSQTPTATDSQLRAAPPPQTTVAPGEAASIPIAPPAAGGPITPTDLAARLGGIEARLAAVENGLARAGDRDLQIALQSRITRLESESSGEALHRAGLVLALATLARAASEPSPFKPQLDAMAALAPGDPSVIALGPYAESGAPTIAILAVRFPDAAREALDAERTANAGDGPFGHVWSSLTGLIRIRRIGETNGTTSADRLARAESLLSRRDLTNAVSEVRSLDGEAKAKMAQWLHDAETRLVIESAIAGMETRIVSALAQPTNAAESGPRVFP